MSSFNDNLKNIKIANFAIFIIVSYVVLFILGKFSFPINESWLSIVICFYFIFILKDSFFDFKNDFSNVFSKIQLKYILLIVFANIFFSYGMLYLAIVLVKYFPVLNFLVDFYIPSMMSLTGPLPIIGAFISTVIISPFIEELIFRGVLLSKLKFFVPATFAVLISSLLFGALHSFGGIISAVVFGICMAILYLKTDNICVPILTHFLNNLFAEIIRFFDFNNLLFTDMYVISIVGILAVVSAIILFTSIRQEWNKIK